MACIKYAKIYANAVYSSLFPSIVFFQVSYSTFHTGTVACTFLKELMTHCLYLF